MPDPCPAGAEPANFQEHSRTQGEADENDPCRFPLEFSPPVVRFRQRVSPGVRVLEAALDEDMQAWCSDHIGRYALDADALHVDIAGDRLCCTIRFESESDRLAFRLRWL